MASPSNFSLYEFLIFSRKEKLLFYDDLKNPNNILTQTEIINAMEKTQKHRMENISGIAEATKSLVEKLSPTQILTFKFFSTNKYKYNIYELITGLKFILITGIDNNDYSDLLGNIYNEAYVEFVTRNLFYKKDTIIDSKIFLEKIRDMFKQYK